MAPKYGEFVIEKYMHLTVTRESMQFLPLEGMVSEHTNDNMYTYYGLIYILAKKQTSSLSKFSENSWLFAHEAGHCLGGMHVRPKGASFDIYNYYTLT